ncbi:MAG: LON peptidase substrate-binding domain-containing protein [Planctomycetes bacterium]|nr:LON peptidase substrate-binding domain-containing protein [Planctomycetota bacterium]
MKATRIPIVPLQGTTPFPGCATIFEADREYIERVSRHVNGARGQVALVKWTPNGTSAPRPEDLSPVGVLARIAILPFVEDKVIVAVEGSTAIKLQQIQEDADGVMEGTPLDSEFQTTRQQAG